jgi:parallel beta-helix repeat protein
MAYASPYTDINVNTAYNMITNGSYPYLVVLDVRTQSEYDSGHIYGAVWIPVTELEARISELVDHKNHEIIVYCKSGGRSATASAILDSHNFTKVYNMLGGITAWQSAGYPVWIATVHNIETTFNYDTIQAAIDAPQTLNGHTVFVETGTYYENVIVNKTVLLIGENRENTIIDGRELGNTISITADDVVIEGFTVTNSSSTYPNAGIYLDNVKNSTITDNKASRNYGHGIFVMWGSNNSILDNLVMHNAQPGIRIDGPEARANVTGNTIQYNKQDGIFLYYAYNVHIENNTITNNMENGITPQGGSNQTTMQNNLIADNTLHGIFVAHSSNNTISENEITANKELGIYLRGSNNTYTYGNTLTSDGMYVRESFGNIVEDNTVNGRPLVYLEVMSSQTVGDAGQVILVNCSDIRVESLNLSNTDVGLELWLTNNSTVANSNITNNLVGVLLANSSNNEIYHNNFIDNVRKQVSMPSYAPPSTNAWDDGYPSGGNYWSDYTNVDLHSGSYQNETDSDGIWDHSYVIDENNTDNYPLTKPYSGPHDIGIASVTTSKTVVGQGYSLCINLTILNYGVYDEIFNVTAYANTTIMDTTANITHTFDVTTLVAVSGLTPNIDGFIGAGEWDDANTVTVSVTEGADCMVYAKQDGVNLYVGFNIPDATYNSSDHCVIIFDVDHDGSQSLQTDDMWLFASRVGTEKEYNVTAGGWYPTTVSAWSANVSSTAGAWQSEYSITYSKLDVTAGTNKTLGVMFLIVDKDVAMGWYVWPSTASISQPATWGDIASNGYNWLAHDFSRWTSLLLTSRNSTTITFTWDTTGFATGNYTIGAIVTPVLGEMDLTDNTYVNGWVVVTIPGDINGDFKVNHKDLLLLAGAYGSKTGDTRYIPEADVNGDGKIDHKDLLILAANYGEGA